MGLQPVIPYLANLFKAYCLSSNHIPLELDYLNAEEIMQLSQIFHLKLLLQKLLQIRDVNITISHDNLLINIEDYDYNPMICLFHI